MRLLPWDKTLENFSTFYFILCLKALPVPPPSAPCMVDFFFHFQISSTLITSNTINNEEKRSKLILSHCTLTRITIRLLSINNWNELNVWLYRPHSRWLAYYYMCIYCIYLWEYIVIYLSTRINEYIRFVGESRDARFRGVIKSNLDPYWEPCQLR